MIIHTLTVNNFGLFRGEHTLSLTPKGTGPIILIGGMNGAGKTTLLEAVRLCLYGRRALGDRVGQNEYHEYLFNMIHRNPHATVPLNAAAVSLEFEYAYGAEKREYRVKRLWQQCGQTVDEVLTVSEPHQSRNDFEKEHWQDYLNGILPIGVSQFFFFDGEDIQKLAGDSSQGIFLADSIKALLGLNLVERLQSDLRIYSNRLVKRGSPGPVQEEIGAVESVVSSLEASLSNMTVEKESLRSRIEELSAAITRQEERIAAEGWSYAQSREDLKLRRERLQNEIEELEDEIRVFCDELLPFALAPELLKRLAERLLKEMELDEWEATNNALTEHNTEVLETLGTKTFWKGTSLSSSQIVEIRDKIASVLTTRLECSERLRGVRKIRDRSLSEYNRLLTWIDACLTEVPQEFRQLNLDLRDAQLELQKVEETLQRVPSDEVLKPLIEKLSELNQTLGQLQNQEQDTEKFMLSLTRQLAETERRLERLHQAKRLDEAYRERQKRVSNVQSVLSAYTTKLTETKILTLGNTIVEGFNQLSRKQDRIKRVEMDPQTFAVTLYDTHDLPIAKEELSAGEKQMYTTALLWGLAKTSGKALPMILDTPLGRLDSDHRRLLIERYFPYASHQVVLLSTDTEVDAHLYKLLQPHISHAFRLVYRDTEARTTIEKGYFG